MSSITEALEAHEYAYLTTTGRRSGRPHRIEIWFVVVDDAVWVGSGGHERSDWVRNLQADARLELEIGGRTWPARATLHPDVGDHPARRQLAARYQGWRTGDPLSAWARDSLLVQIEVADAC